MIIFFFENIFITFISKVCYTLSSLFNKKGGDDMLEVYHTLNLGTFLAPILQGIVIHVVAYILIDIYKNRK